MCIQLYTHAQSNDTLPAQFKAGEDSLIQFINKNFIVSDSCQGITEVNIKIKFVVDIDGDITLQDVINAEYNCVIEDAIAFIARTDGMWEPATYKGKKINSVFTLPIILDFEEEKTIEVIDVFSKPAEFYHEDKTLIQFLYSSIDFNKECMIADSGKVKITIEFTVDTIGNIGNEKILTKAKQCFNSSVLNAVRLTNGRWIPAYKNGKPIMSTMKIPFVVSFGSEYIGLNQFYKTELSIIEIEADKANANNVHTKYKKLKEEKKYVEAIVLLDLLIKTEKNNLEYIFEKIKVLVILNEIEAACQHAQMILETNQREYISNRELVKYCTDITKQHCR